MGTPRFVEGLNVPVLQVVNLREIAQKRESASTKLIGLHPCDRFPRKPCRSCQIAGRGVTLCQDAEPVCCEGTAWALDAQGALKVRPGRAAVAVRLKGDGQANFGGRFSDCIADLPRQRA